MQIVGEADQLYGVAHTNRVSNVYCIRREDALAFLQVRAGTHGPSGARGSWLSDMGMGAAVCFTAGS